MESLADIADLVLAKIDEECISHWDDGHRGHLGGSVIGSDCARQLWYGFRWVKHVEHKGRQLRLFNRGHYEEPRFVQYLKWVGFDVSEVTNKGKQHRISGVGGHFGGSLDGIGTCPDWLRDRLKALGVPIEQTYQILLEFKTSNTKNFKKLVKQGVKSAKPEHFSQMCTYGAKRGLQYALYMCVCKETDDLHVELVLLDHQHGEDMERRAKDIITAQVPPMKQSEDPNLWKCKFCDYRDNCHEDVPYEQNCRSCKSATPVMTNAQWWCGKYNVLIPSDKIGDGCPGGWEAVGT